LQLKQRTYDWRGDLAERAILAVKAFFGRHLTFDVDPELRASYVAWAVPEATEEIDERDNMVVRLPRFFPFMWKEFDGTDPDNPVSHLFSMG
jgi:hypothetical protein